MSAPPKGQRHSFADWRRAAAPFALLSRWSLCAALALATHFAAGASHPPADAAPDAFVPVPLDNEHLAGLVATRTRANSEGLLEHVTERQLKDPSAAGLFLEAATNAFASTGDSTLKHVMDRLAQSLITRKSEEADSLTGKADLMIGLVAYGNETGEDNAIDAARKVADPLLKTDWKSLGESEPCGRLISGFLALFRSTGDGRYLQAARGLSGRKPGRDENGIAFADSLVDYYRQSGDDNVLKRAVEFWHSFQPTITGAPEPSGNTCMTAAWFELTLDLLRATAEPAYADALEATMYNQLLAVQEPQAGHVYTAAPLDGTKGTASDSDVCAFAEARALSDAPQALWGRVGNGVAVFNYVPGRASIRLRRRSSVQIYAETNYPEEGDIVLHVEPSRETRFRLELRVPSWSQRFEVVSGSTRVAGKPGDMLTLARDWKKGDTVRISIEMGVTEQPDPYQERFSALLRGPQVLALTSQENSKLSDITKASWASGSSIAVSPASRDSHMPMNTMAEQAFSVTGVYDGKPEELILVPFAEASSSYRVWLARR